MINLQTLEVLNKECFIERFVTRNVSNRSRCCMLHLDFQHVSSKDAVCTWLMCSVWLVTVLEINRFLLSDS